MAAMIRLLAVEVQGLVLASYERKHEAEVHRQTEYMAAVKIQSWFRGTRVREYLKYLNSCAIEIQRRWRGFIGRKFFRILVKNSVLILKLNYYNKMATLVQKMWRGFYIRKYVFNYYSRKRYLEALKVKNEIIRSELAEFAEEKTAVLKRIEGQRQRARMEEDCRKNHHLISTKAMPSIYNSPFLSFPMEQEFLLRRLKPKPTPKKKKDLPPFDPAWASYNEQLPTALPPLPQKPQGPFRDPADVQKQRYKPFHPSLRVASDYYSLEKARRVMKEQEWVARLNDEKFLPFSHRERHYEKLLHATSLLTPMGYGTKFFREEDPTKHLHPLPFKTLVPPIPVFDKLNNTYSECHGQPF